MGSDNDPLTSVSTTRWILLCSAPISHGLMSRVVSVRLHDVLRDIMARELQQQTYCGRDLSWQIFLASNVSRSSQVYRQPV